jgi:hypothetical protein
METKHQERLFGKRLLFLTALLVGGCSGALRAAVVEHADASRTVAATLQKLPPTLHCEALTAEQSAACKVSVTILSGQAQALRDSADRLERATR